MYVILVYDFGEKRVAKMLKLCRRYLNWVENSVFEGEISDVRLKELLMYIKMFMKVNEDSIIIFKTASQVFMERQIIGRQLGSTDNFL